MVAGSSPCVRGRIERPGVLVQILISLFFNALRRDRVTLQFGDVSVHFAVHFLDLVLADAVCPPGPMPFQPGPALNTDVWAGHPVAQACRVCSASSVVHSARVLRLLTARAARVRDRQSLRARRRSALTLPQSPGRDRHRLPSPIPSVKTHPNARPRGQPKQPLRPRQRTFQTSSTKAPAATRPADPRPRVSTRRRDSRRRAPHPLLERPRLTASMPCHAGPAR